jgi:hypothetical protein
MKCRWFQFLINRALDDGRPLSPRTERHLAQCAVCGQSRQRQLLVAERLSADRPLATDAEASPFLRTRILNHVKSEPQFAPSINVGRWAWAAVASVALVVALFAIPRRSNESLGPIANKVPAASRSPVVSVALLESTARFTSGGSWLQAATNLDQPLQKEMDLVINDARKVLRSLTADLLPAQLLANRE